MEDGESVKDCAIKVLAKSKDGSWNPDEKALEMIFMSEKVKNKKVFNI